MIAPSAPCFRQQRAANNATVPPETSQPAIRRLLPRPAALSVTDDAGAPHRHQVPRIWFPWVIRERDAASRAVRREQMKTGWDQTTGMLMAFAMMPLFGGLAWVGMKLGLPIYWIYAGALIAGAGFAWVLWWIAHRRLERHWQSLGRQWTDAGLSRGSACTASQAPAPMTAG